MGNGKGSHYRGKMAALLKSGSANLTSILRSQSACWRCQSVRAVIAGDRETVAVVTLTPKRFASGGNTVTQQTQSPAAEVSLAGRVALVTGSTSGIGLGIAESLARRGCHIILHGFGDPQVIQDAKNSVERFHVKSHFDETDLCDPDSVQKIEQSVKQVFPQGVDILVNNAGFQSVSEVMEFPLDVWQRMLTVQLTAPFMLTQQFLPGMIQKGWGRIVNVSSIHGLVASPFKAAYVSAKHGLIGLTKVVALETARTGVTCNAVCPGWVETPLFVKQAETRSKEQSISYEDARRQMVSTHPSEEPVKVEDVGELVVFVCSPSANQMTGSSLVIDGGWTAR